MPYTDLVQKPLVTYAAPKRASRARQEGCTLKTSRTRGIACASSGGIGGRCPLYPEYNSCLQATLALSFKRSSSVKCNGLLYTAHAVPAAVCPQSYAWTVLAQTPPALADPMAPSGVARA